MGTKGQGILKISPEEVVALLNKALAEEWLAVFQYWAGAQICRGALRPQIQGELLQHMQEELKHADKLAKRIVQLGGKPVNNPADILKTSGDGYEAPDNPSTRALLPQNIRGEQHAILYYNEILEKVRGKDPVTHNIVVEILKDEIEHEQDLEDLLNDIQES
jgi:bacterioferritin